MQFGCPQAIATRGKSPENNMPSARRRFPDLAETGGRRSLCHRFVRVLVYGHRKEPSPCRGLEWDRNLDEFAFGTSPSFHRATVTLPNLRPLLLGHLSLPRISFAPKGQPYVSPGQRPGLRYVRASAKPQRGGAIPVMRRQFGGGSCTFEIGPPRWGWSQIRLTWDPGRRFACPGLT